LPLVGLPQPFTSRRPAFRLSVMRLPRPGTSAPGGVPPPGALNQPVACWHHGDVALPCVPEDAASRAWPGAGGMRRRERKQEPLTGLPGVVTVHRALAAQGGVGSSRGLTCCVHCGCGQCYASQPAPAQVLGRRKLRHIEGAGSARDRHFTVRSSSLGLGPLRPVLWFEGTRCDHGRQDHVCGPA